MCYCRSCLQLFTTPGYIISKASKGLCNKCAFSPQLKVCRTCCKKFKSRTLLFKHLDQNPSHQVDQYDLHMTKIVKKQQEDVQFNNETNWFPNISVWVSICLVIIWVANSLAASKSDEITILGYRFCKC